MKIPLDFVTITIAAITIGIAVDDCIHYLYRYKAELVRLKDPIATMHYCHNNIAQGGVLYDIDDHRRFFDSAVVELHSDHPLRHADRCSDDGRVAGRR